MVTTTLAFPDEFEEDGGKHSDVRGIRREAQAERSRRNAAAKPQGALPADNTRRPVQPRTGGARRRRRGRDTHLVVTSELRDTPDVRKIARAVIQLALAQAEADAAAAEATADEASSNGASAEATE